MPAERARLLIVDDEPNVLATLQPILEGEGYTVDVAATVEEAKARLGESYDAVVTDLRLPDGDGMEVVDALRRERPGTPAIVLTGFASLESSVEALHRGVYDYLLKPCDVDELKSTVRRAVEHSHFMRERGKLAETVQKLVDALGATKRELEMALARERAMVVQLRERDRERNEFIANVSHEFKTPLTAIRGYGQLLLRQAKDGDADHPYLDAILRASQQLAHLVDEMLEMTQAEGGMLRVQRRSADVGEIVRAGVATVKPMADEKGIALSSHVSEGLPAILCDPDKLGQVLNNLLSNALKFTAERGRVAVDVLHGGGLAHVQVRDTGVGIPPEEQTRVFSRFFRSSTAPPSHPGLGLGLYISRAIVEAHAGMIWVESEPGLGTTVHFTVPFAEAGAAPPSDSTVTPAVGTPAAPSSAAPSGAGKAPRRARRRDGDTTT